MCREEDGSDAQLAPWRPKLIMQDQLSQRLPLENYPRLAGTLIVS